AARILSRHGLYGVFHIHATSTRIRIATRVCAILPAACMTLIDKLKCATARAASGEVRAIVSCGIATDGSPRSRVVVTDVRSRGKGFPIPACGSTIRPAGDISISRFWLVETAGSAQRLLPLTGRTEPHQAGSYPGAARQTAGPRRPHHC